MIVIKNTVSTIRLIGNQEILILISGTKGISLNKFRFPFPSGNYFCHQYFNLENVGVANKNEYIKRLKENQVRS